MNQHDILGLDIPVENLLVMNVTYRVQKVTRDEGSALLRKGLPILDYIVKLSTLSKF